jgi:hypothetical protein
VLLGLAGGFVASFAAARLLSSLLVDVKPNDPMVFTLAPPVLLVAALAACLARAARTGPALTLRVDGSGEHSPLTRTLAATVLSTMSS